MFHILRQLWTDDAELASFLTKTYGIKTIVGEFSENSSNLSAAATHTWSWRAQTGDWSTITILDDLQAGQDGTPSVHYFWQNGQGLGQLLFKENSLGTQGNRAGNGTMVAPTLFANDFQGHFAGVANWHPLREATGLFTLYDDLYCKKPRW